MGDIFEAARNKISSGLIRSFFNSQGSYSQKGEYYILSPLRADKSVGSFHINEESGQWFDHAGDEGGDFIDLVSRSLGISVLEAAERIISESGGVYIESEDHDKPEKKKDKKAVQPLLPIPDTDAIKTSLKNRVTDTWCQDNWGRATTATRYYNEKGEWRFVVCRFEKDKGKNKKRAKNDILLYLGVDNKWYAKWHEDLKPFPPLGIEKLKDNDLPYCIVEGEKCQRVEIPGYNVISWIGGTANVSKTDWKLLRRREGVMWPDADSAMDKNEEYHLSRQLQPGMKAAYFIKSELPKTKILDIYRHKPIEESPSGWDIADFMEEKGADPVQFIEEYTPYNSVSVEADPFEVYRKFIEDFYEIDSLEQASGGFWNYDKERHFWEKILRNDIYCNFQRWMEDTGLQWIIAKKKKVTSFINETKQYIDRHSLGYINENPFKDAATSPYVHLRNGAIKINKNSIGWIPRGKFEESYFKNLYPINCLDFEFDYDNYKTVNPEKDCPAFYYVVKELIPRNYLNKMCAYEEGVEEYSRQLEKVIFETMVFISQVLAYAISPIKPNEYIFGIYGNERTGKSFLLKIIKSIIGKDFCVEKKIADMDNRFASSGLWGKKVFIEPDLKTREPLPEDFIKAYAGEQEISIEEKNQPSVDGVKISIAMFFISNYEFHAKGVEGLARRLVMIPYKNPIKKHDARLLDKILGEYPHGSESCESAGMEFDERPAILALAMKGWERFCANDYKIEIPEWVQNEKDIWLIESNSVAKFLQETYFATVETERINRKDIYEQYKLWCTDEGRKPLGKKNFYEEVRRDDRITEGKWGGFDVFHIEKPEQGDIPF